MFSIFRRQLNTIILSPTWALDFCERGILMGTTIKPEISKKNPYWISKHRYYELKHFVLQYNEWKRNYISLLGVQEHQQNEIKRTSTSDPTYNAAQKLLYFKEKIDLVDNTAKSIKHGDIILKNILACKSYDVCDAIEPLPISKKKYYQLYRRFFWLLNKVRE